MTGFQFKMLAIAVEFFIIGFIVGGLFIAAYFVRKSKEEKK